MEYAPAICRNRGLRTIREKAQTSNSLKRDCDTGVDRNRPGSEASNGAPLKFVDPCQYPMEARVCLVEVFFEGVVPMRIFALGIAHANSVTVSYRDKYVWRLPLRVAIRAKPIYLPFVVTPISRQCFGPPMVLCRFYSLQMLLSKLLATIPRTLSAP